MNLKYKIPLYKNKFKFLNKLLIQKKFKNNFYKCNKNLTI